jgi:hypothetical protein
MVENPMHFNEFCGLVPGSVTQISLSPNAPLTYVTQGLPEFVAPKLKTRLDVDVPAQPRVLVVSAPGAVGKSTLARQLAYGSKLPYWDLAQYGTVGQGTIGGAFTASVGFQAMGQVQSALAGGNLAIVVDALDEARVKVNEAAFEDFVNDIAQFSKLSPAISFVLLGRNQIAETTWLILTEAGVDVGFYVIEAFERSDATIYVDRRVAKISTDAAQRMQTHPTPFREARDLILDRLEQAIAGSQPNDVTAGEARDFVGYAPVLEAVSVLLAGEGNWEQLRARVQAEIMEGANAQNRATALLRSVVERILQREHEAKLIANIKPVLQGAAQQAGWSNWSQLYTSTEQCERLVAKLVGIPYHAALNLPGPVEALYEQHISSWLPEHPFLRDGNSVFTSFLFANAVFGTKQRAEVEAHLASRTYKPSRLFADFYFLNAPRGSGGQLQLPPAHVGLLYDALKAGESDRVALRTTIEGDADEDAQDQGPELIDGEFELVDLTTLDADEPRITTLEFTVTAGPQDTLQFRRYLRDTAIAVSCSVELGSGAGEFEIGPSVSVRAGTLRLSTPALIVGGKTKIRKLGEEHDNSVVLEASRAESNIVERPVTHVDLTVSWPGCEVFPWSAYASKADTAIREDARLRRTYIRFRRIVMTLRSHSKGSLARVKHKIEHSRVLQGAVGKALLRQLVADDVLVLRGNFYHLVPERSDQHTGISWMELRRGRSSDRLKTYLNSFVRANGALFT